LREFNRGGQINFVYTRMQDILLDTTIIESGWLRDPKELFRSNWVGIDFALL